MGSRQGRTWGSHRSWSRIPSGRVGAKALRWERIRLAGRSLAVVGVGISIALG